MEERTLSAHLLDDFGRLDVVHPNLGRHDNDIVLGDVVAGRAQAVPSINQSQTIGTRDLRLSKSPIEHCADVTAVGEREQSRSVPRFHGAAGPPIKVLLLLHHERVLLPRFRYHRHHGLRRGD